MGLPCIGARKLRQSLFFHYLKKKKTFILSYRYDITDVLHDAHISPEDVFDVHEPFSIKVEIHAVNGSALPASSISAPTIIFEPAHGTWTACAEFLSVGLPFDVAKRSPSSVLTLSAFTCPRKSEKANSPYCSSIYSFCYSSTRPFIQKSAEYAVILSWSPESSQPLGIIPGLEYTENAGI